MIKLKNCLESLGFVDATTYIASGNVVLKSSKSALEVKKIIEDFLPKNFKLSGNQIKVLVLNKSQLKNIIDKKPKGFGDNLIKYHSDVIFLIGISPAKAKKIFNPREGVDRIWVGQKVIYSERLIKDLTKSRLNKIVGTPEYKYMTIRNWNTTQKLLELMSRK